MSCRGPAAVPPAGGNPVRGRSVRCYRLGHDQLISCHASGVRIPIEHVEPSSRMGGDPVSEHPEHRPEAGPDEAATPVPNRRERRGGKSAKFAPRTGRSAAGPHHGMAPNPRQYSTRRRGG